MLTLDALKQFGADTDDGLSRCMGNEAFYFKLIGKVIDDSNFKILEDAVAAKDLDKAFEAAHSLKGVLGNLALTPIYEPVCEVTELLRAKPDVDYSEYLKKISDKRSELAGLLK
ncbi:Hpt domain-containing protein [Ruminococcaceae bacterium YAD3003]|nr:Hpt domain-containing protein [Ruminococcaceae bacterium YAD3003]